LRRLIRRAARFSKSLDQVDGIINIYRELYPQLVQKKEEIKETLRTEEKKFRQTLDRGLKEFAKISQKGSISPQEAFYLYESLGFPYELTQEESQNKNIKIASRDEFDEEVKKHQGQSRTASAGTFKGGLADHSEIVTKYHTATHLLHAALRKILGDTVCQQGSNLTAERLRFDFSYSQKLTIEEIKKVEGLVNEQINRGLVQKTETMSFDEAIKSGALAFFKEKYPEKVTVYTFGDFSREVCGGPHVENTKTLGQFEILKEESVSSGIRRLYARLHFR
ncbi:MAG: alanine--tRNA ligase-related protein, partial [Patescibacteria group bacterium]